MLAGKPGLVKDSLDLELPPRLIVYILVKVILLTTRQKAVILIKRRRFPKVFSGWWTVLGGGILGLWIAGYGSYGISALFKPIAGELGFSRAAASVPGGITRLEGGFEGPLSGWATDRFGARNVIFLGVLAAGVGLVLMNYIHSLWAFYIFWGVLLGTGHNIATGVPLDAAIANWFVKKRGTALGIKNVFMGLSGVLVLPLIAWLINQQGWRLACLIGGLVTLLVGLPFAWFFIKPRRPEYYGLFPDGATVQEEATDTSQMIEWGVKYASEAEEAEFTLRQAMRTRAYWLLVTALVGHGFAWGAFTVHLIPYLTDIGIDPLRAAGVMAVMVFSSLPTRFIAGFFVDHLSKNRIRFIMAGGYLIQTLGIAIFLLNPKTIPVIYIWLILYGIGLGTGFSSNAMVARYYGRKAYGSIRGSIMAFLAGPGMAAPIYAGWLYDTTGSYMTLFIVMAVAFPISAVIMATAAPPRAPARVTDIRKIV